MYTFLEMYEWVIILHCNSYIVTSHTQADARQSV